MAKLLIITTVYNRLPLVRQCVEAVLKNTKGKYLLGLVYNNPPYDDVEPYLDAIEKKHSGNVVVLKPGVNLGCHRGFNYGYEQLANNSKYVVKLDDDTIVGKNWNTPMMGVLRRDRQLAYLAANINTKHGSKFYIKKIDRYTIEIPQKGAVGFSCVMFPVRAIKQIGLLMNRDNLYGGEERDYLIRTRERGLYGAYLREVTVHHLDNEDRDIDYALWKFWYGYLNKTELDFETFRQDKAERELAWTFMLNYNNDWWRVKAAEHFERK